MAKVMKSRYWAMSVYPESAPKDWKERLGQTGLRCAISPLHDKDLEEPDENGEVKAKKPHWHVIICWDGPTTYNAAKNLAESVGGVIMPRPLNAVRGYYRYLTHADNPDKYQYDERLVERVNDWCLEDYVHPTAGDVLKLKVDVHRYVLEHDLCEYGDLTEKLLAENLMEMYNHVTCHTMHYGALMYSRRHRLNGGENK